MILDNQREDKAFGPKFSRYFFYSMSVHVNGQYDITIAVNVHSE
jgi:hypothetical protein